MPWLQCRSRRNGFALWGRVTVFPKVPIQAYLRARRVFSKFQVHARCKKASGKGLVQQFCELAWGERRAISARSSRPPRRTPERRKSPAQSPVRLAVFAAEIWTSHSSFGVGIAARFLGPRRLQNGAHFTQVRTSRVRMCIHVSG